MTRRPKTGTHPHHDRIHDNITRRLEYLNELAAGQRRRAVRQIAWAIGDHLRCCHGVRNVTRRPVIPDLALVHGYLHAETGRKTHR